MHDNAKMSIESLKRELKIQIENFEIEKRKGVDVVIQENKTLQAKIADLEVDFVRINKEFVIKKEEMESIIESLKGKLENIQSANEREKISLSGNLEDLKCGFWSICFKI